MRPISLVPVLVSLLSVPAFAGASTGAKGSHAHCTVTADKDDRVVQGKSLRLEPDARVKEAVALHGDVIVPKGATVQKATAVDGTVVLEPGARVNGDVTALGGNVKLGEGVEVGGDVTVLGGELQAAPSAVVKGDRHSFSLHINGDDLVRQFLEKTIRDEKCLVVAEKDAGAAPEAPSPEPEVEGALDKEQVRQVIQSHLKEIESCHQTVRARAPDLAGTVSVKFVVAADGSVTTAGVAKSTARSADLELCVAGRVQTWTFPRPRGGGMVVVTYPFTFGPTVR